jgi:hypothetical protein
MPEGMRCICYNMQRPWHITLWALLGQLLLLVQIEWGSGQDSITSWCTAQLVAAGHTMW